MIYGICLAHVNIIHHSKPRELQPSVRFGNRALVTRQRLFSSLVTNISVTSAVTSGWSTEILFLDGVDWKTGIPVFAAVGLGGGILEEAGCLSPESHTLWSLSGLKLYRLTLHAPVMRLWHLLPSSCATASGPLGPRSRGKSDRRNTGFQIPLLRSHICYLPSQSKSSVPA